jgi:hypothetical protein
MANCTGGNVTTKDVTFSDVSIASPQLNPISFKVLGNGTNIPSGTTITINITQAGTNSLATVVMTSGGEIR